MKKVAYKELSVADKILLKNGFDLNGNQFKSNHRSKKPIKLSKKQQEENQALIEKRKTTKPTPPERIISDFLKNENFVFKREYYMSGMYNRYTKKLLFFDFFIPELNLAIEYDGEHHFKPIYGNDKLVMMKRNDTTKDAFCKKNKIHLLRIPYWMCGRIKHLIVEKIDTIRIVTVNKNSECH